MEVVLVGNPNVGKTTLFNSLTKSSQHTGNWHGVTVDNKAKTYKFLQNEFNVVDLPGIYSLSPLSYEEKVAVEYIYNAKNSLVLNIVDINNLNRNLYLTMELVLANVNTILVVNTMGKKNTKKITTKIKNLEQKLGVTVIEINAQNERDILNLKNVINDYFNQKYIKNNSKISLKIQKNIKDIKNCIDFSNYKGIFCKDFICLKVLENDNFYINKLNLNKKETSKNQDFLEQSLQEKYNLIDDILCNNNQKTSNQIYGKSKLDKIVLNRVFALPIFLFVLLTIFYLTFFSVGKFFSQILMSFIQNNFGEWLISGITNLTNSAIIIDFFEGAIVGGLGTIFSFLPQVVMLFLCLGILEDSGYLSRVAFCLDDIFSCVGLSGKSVYTLLMGFGCSTTACMTARCVEDKNSKIKTAMLAPYMSCSAKLPIYAVIGSAFFGACNVFVIFGMYLLGVLVAICLSVFYEKTFLKSGRANFILEFPKYRGVSCGRIINLISTNVKQFLVRIGSVLVSVNIIIWVLSSFSFSFGFVKITGQASMLETLGKFISPIFSPLGFGTWGASSALIAGLIAKEVIVSSIAMFNGITNTGQDFYSKISKSLSHPSSAVCFSPASAISFMSFCLLYSPCLATMSVLKQELGKKWLFVSIIVQFVLAYGVCLVLYTSTNIILNKGILTFLAYFSMFAIVLFSGLYFLTKNKKNTCKFCKRCK